jgi:hypothetical protein
VSLVTASGWLLPAAEPFRISAIVGRRLAALEARERAKPVLCTYQLPGIVFALGHPAPIVRTRSAILETVGREGKVIAALVPYELLKYQSEPGLVVTVRETIQGFNVDKGRFETLHLSAIAPAAVAIVERTRATSVR